MAPRMPHIQYAPEHSEQPSHMFDHEHFADHGLAFFAQNFLHGLFESVGVVAGAEIVVNATVGNNIVMHVKNIPNANT